MPDVTEVQQGDGEFELALIGLAPHARVLAFVRLLDNGQWEFVPCDEWGNPRAIGTEAIHLGDEQERDVLRESLERAAIQPEGALRDAALAAHRLLVRRQFDQTADLAISAGKLKARRLEW